MQNVVAAAANCAWLASSVPAALRFRRALANPERVQSAILANLIERNRRTAFGRAHRLDQIRNFEEFRVRVPIRDYDEYEPWITRIMQGETAVLTEEPVTRLVPTSGSSGARKLIPYTAGLQRELNSAIGPWIAALYREHPALALGPSYWSISPAMPTGLEESAVPIGFDDDSAYLGGFRQRMVEAAFAVPSALRMISDVPTWRYVTCLSLLRCRELRLISVWHPSFLSLMLDSLRSNWNELLADVRDGTCAYAATLPPAVRNAVKASSSQTRAQELARHGSDQPESLWPFLRVVSCWGDGQAGLALADLQRRLPRAHIQPKGLIATEGIVSIPYDGKHPIAITSHFYEFEDAAGQIHRAHELQCGEQYRVILTTGGGLWRYRLGDQVEVDGFCSGTPSLRFLGRGRSISDLAGEKLSEAFVTQAIGNACSRLGLAPGFAMLAPEKVGEVFRYSLFTDCEFSSELAGELDAELRKNPHYALCQDLGQLGPVCVCGTGATAFDTYVSVLLEQGRRIGDIKPQALSTRCDWRVRFGHVNTALAAAAVQLRGVNRNDAAASGLVREGTSGIDYAVSGAIGTKLSGHPAADQCPVVPSDAASAGAPIGPALSGDNATPSGV